MKKFCLSKKSIDMRTSGKTMESTVYFELNKNKHWISIAM